MTISTHIHHFIESIDFLICIILHRSIGCSHEYFLTDARDEKTLRSNTFNEKIYKHIFLDIRLSKKFSSEDFFSIQIFYRCQRTNLNSQIQAELNRTRKMEVAFCIFFSRFSALVK